MTIHQDQEERKQAAAEAAVRLIESGMTIGVGSGSTVRYFIDALQPIKHKIEGAVASSIDTANRLKAIGIPLVDLNTVSDLALYVDGADEINTAKQMIKGGGGALTREKIIATVAKQFVCIIDRSKQVDQLGAFPVALEVIPMARSLVARAVVQLGGSPVYRTGFVTDNHNVILDIHHLPLTSPKQMERTLKAMIGVVESGIFAQRTADIVLMRY